MIVDPWGSVVAQCGEGEGLALAEINTARLASVRANMPGKDETVPAINVYINAIFINKKCLHTSRTYCS